MPEVSLILMGRRPGGTFSGLHCLCGPGNKNKLRFQRVVGLSNISAFS